MKRILTWAVLTLLVLGAAKAQDNDMIGKSNIKLSSRMMTPEALWAMGRIGTVAASPDGSKVAYQVGYYNVKANKSRQVICVMPTAQVTPHLLPAARARPTLLGSTTKPSPLSVAVSSGR